LQRDTSFSRILAGQLQSSRLEAEAMTSVGLMVIDAYRCLEIRVLTDINVRNAATLRTGILSNWEERGRPGPLVLDLAGARHIDSSGVGALLEIFHRTDDAGVALIIRGLRSSPRRMLERTGVGELFQLESAAHASQSLHAGHS
jgi:anti-anti-sigma factor